jgi:hypothetical protein
MCTEDDLLRQLNGVPEVEIAGIVSAGGISGVGGSGFNDDSFWTVLITLSGWRPAGLSLRKSELVVRKKVTLREVEGFRAAAKPYDVIRVRARLAEESVFGSPQALLTEYVGKDDSDAALNAYASELQNPVTFSDSTFGLFTLDRRIDWYQAHTEWCGDTVYLMICNDTPSEMEKSLAVARELWQDASEWQRKFAECAIRELLATKNSCWLEDGDPEVSENEFLQRMALAVISVEADRSFEFSYDDGDLFWGHSIVVRGNLTNGPTSAGIEG